MNIYVPKWGVLHLERQQYDGYKTAMKVAKLRCYLSRLLQFQLYFFFFFQKWWLWKLFRCVGSEKSCWSYITHLLGRVEWGWTGDCMGALKNSRWNTTTWEMMWRQRSKFIMQDRKQLQTVNRWEIWLRYILFWWIDSRYNFTTSDQICETVWRKSWAVNLDSFLSDSSVLQGLGVRFTFDITIQVGKSAAVAAAAAALGIFSV